MTDEERAEAATKWDSRSPLERLLSLPRDERTAFTALFNGGRGKLQGCWRADIDREFKPSFGKAECEWVDFNLWRLKLPGLRLTTFEEGPRKCALGMPPGSVVWDILITVTEDGFAAREAYLNRTVQEIVEAP